MLRAVLSSLQLVVKILPSLLSCFRLFEGHRSAHRPFDRERAEILLNAHSGRVMTQPYPAYPSAIEWFNMLEQVLLLVSQFHSRETPFAFEVAHHCSSTFQQALDAFRSLP